MPLASSMAPLGTALPDITLPDLEGEIVNVAEFANGRPLVVAFTCNHCPYVQHIETELGRLADDFPGVTVVAICANDTTAYPADDVPGLRSQAQRAGWHFPYLRDIDQQVARTLTAVCTPDFFCFDRDGFLVYRGAFDESRPGQPTSVTGDHLRAALAQVQAGIAVPEPHQPSLGCGIKWKPGNQPA